MRGCGCARKTSGDAMGEQEEGKEQEEGGGGSGVSLEGSIVVGRISGSRLLVRKQESDHVEVLTFNFQAASQLRASRHTQSNLPNF